MQFPLPAWLTRLLPCIFAFGSGSSAKCLLPVCRDSAKQLWVGCRRAQMDEALWQCLPQLWVLRASSGRVWVVLVCEWELHTVLMGGVDPRRSPRPALLPRGALVICCNTHGACCRCWLQKLGCRKLGCWPEKKLRCR